MKNRLFLAAAICMAAFSFTACGGSDTSADKTKTDSTSVIIPPPDNSSATNPSLADTAYSADSSKVKGDTAHHRK